MTVTSRKSETNPYLEANFGPVHEEVTVADLTVTGTIPDHLDGRYLRIGPNPLGAPDPDAYHWFTGEGMVHGLRLRDGKAEWYRNRWVRSGDVADALGEPHRPGPVNESFRDFAPNTNVIGHAGRTFAIAESGIRPYELTDELDTLGPCAFDGTLSVGYTAHPHRDPSSGELHAVSYFFGWGNTVQYTVLSNDAHIVRTVEVEVSGAPMMHDFSLTDGHVVIYDLPVAFDLELVGDGAFPYRWDPDYPARVGVMRRDGDGSDMTWLDVEPCYVFHPLNAYDDGAGLVLDVVRHPKMFDAERLGPNEGPPTLDRWTVDLAAGKVIETRLDNRGQEFPRIDERLTGRRHRYGYAVAAGPETKPDDDMNSVVRHDLVEGRTDVRSFGPGVGVSEFVFVPTSTESAEDDGVLMGFTHHRATEHSTLTILDAQSLESVASVAIPARIPYGFHGNWIPSQGGGPSRSPLDA